MASLLSRAGIMKIIFRVGAILKMGLLSFAIMACGENEYGPILSGESSSTRTDERLLVPAVPVTPAGQTVSVLSTGDAADDVAIWVHPTDLSRSLILGTDKQYGLFVFDLAGREVQRLRLGRLNNIDILPRRDGVHSFAVASNRSSNSVTILRIDSRTGLLRRWKDIPTEELEPYGICATTDRDQNLVAITYKNGMVQILELVFEGVRVSPSLYRALEFGGQVEGCVFDEDAGRLFVGEESQGIWVVEYRDSDSTPYLIDSVDSSSGLVADVEGLAIWRGTNGRGWLVASAQGRDAFMLYDRQPPHRPQGVFRIEATTELDIDAVTHTDGIDITSAALPGFPRGLLVVQDDNEGGINQRQNFKFVHWGDIESALNLPLFDQD